METSFSESGKPLNTPESEKLQKLKTYLTHYEYMIKCSDMRDVALKLLNDTDYESDKLWNIWSNHCSLVDLAWDLTKSAYEEYKNHD